MSAKAIVGTLMRRGRRIFQDLGKAKTQNAQVKVVNVGKQRQNIVTYQNRPLTRSEKLWYVWNRVAPKVYYDSLASQLGRKAAWRGGRNVPLLAFMGLVIAQTEKEDDITEQIQTFIKSTTATPLMTKIQSLSLDYFEIGAQIGQGCNAAVFEARIKEEFNYEKDLTPISSQTTVEDIASESYSSHTGGSDEASTNTETSVNNEAPLNFVVPSEWESELLDQMETDSTMSDTDSDTNSDTDSTTSDADSDITSISFSDDDIEDGNRAPTEFYHEEEYFNNVSDEISEAGSDFSILSVPEDDDIDLVSDQLLSISINPTEIVKKVGEDVQQSTNAEVEEIADLSYTSMNSCVNNCGISGCPTSPKFDLAIKMMFNYGIESRADAIMRGMEKETLPARLIQADRLLDMEAKNGTKVRKKCLPPHPNIVEMWGVFVDPVPTLPDCLVNFPAAMPSRINPKGVGRNMTLFLIMKKYTTTLSDYLSIVHLSFRERLFLLSQLLEGVIHLNKHGVAHRDLKGDNILLDTNTDGMPGLVISDFGCCLADSDHGLQLPFSTGEIDRGGNTALMAPEIACALPGRFAVLDYSKSDLWSVGALAYEILGADNPFYRGKLDSRTYKESELPPLPHDIPEIVRNLVVSLLHTDPAKRPSARLTADVLHLLLWSPEHWQLLGNARSSVTRSEVKWWVITMATEIFLEKEVMKQEKCENVMKRIFLQSFNINNLVVSLRYLGVEVV